MTNIIRTLALTTILSALLPGAQAKEPAAPAAPAAAPGKAAAKTEKFLPYAGVVDVVDKAKQTFTFKETAGERTVPPQVQNRGYRPGRKSAKRR